jgi:hypothetical protein
LRCITRHLRGDARTLLLADDVQSEIEPGGHPGAGEHRTVLDEDAVVEHARPRLRAPQLIDVQMVSGAFAPGQQSGPRRQHAA